LEVWKTSRKGMSFCVPLGVVINIYF
jgi:hypothetical protein